MTTCWVIYNGSLVSDKFADQAHLVAEAAERLLEELNARLGYAQKPAAE